MRKESPSLHDYEVARLALPGDPRLPVDEPAGVLRDRLAAVIAEARAEGRRAGLDEERRRIIPTVEEAIGRGVTDGGQYRADIKSAIGVALEAARAQGRHERDAEVETLRAEVERLRAVSGDPPSAPRAKLA